MDMAKTVITSTLVAVVIYASTASTETYRGLTIAPEHRCTPYNPNDYPYPQSVEAQIVADFGGAITGRTPAPTFAAPATPISSTSSPAPKPTIVACVQQMPPLKSPSPAIS